MVVVPIPLSAPPRSPHPPCLTGQAMLSAFETLQVALTGVRRTARCTDTGGSSLIRRLLGLDSEPAWVRECGGMLSRELANLNPDAIKADDKANMIQVAKTSRWMGSWIDLPHFCHTMCCVATQDIEPFPDLVTCKNGLLEVEVRIVSAEELFDYLPKITTNITQAKLAGGVGVNVMLDRGAFLTAFDHCLYA